MNDVVRPLVALRSNDYCFLGTLRGLAAAGLEHTPVVFDWPGAGAWYSERSRHFLDAKTIPNPHTDAFGAARALAAIADRHRERPLVIPSSDTNIVFLLDEWETLVRHIRVLGDARFETNRVEIVRKDLVAPILEAAGIAAPITRGCRHESEIDRAVREVPLPCVYKPAVKDTGQTFYARHGGLKAVACDDRDELRRLLKQEIARGFELVVQERIPFDSVLDEVPFYAYVDERHQIRMAATAIREKIQPHPFGTPTVLRLGWHPELLPIAREVARAIRWRGPLMIEFIRDPRDGVWKVIELNCRPWLTIDFLRRCGLNYFGALSDDLSGRFDERSDEEVATPSAALLERSPVHLLLGSILDDWEADHGAPVSIASLGDWLRGIPGARSFSLLDPDDPAPGTCELEDLAMRFGLDRRALVAEIESMVDH